MNGDFNVYVGTYSTTLLFGTGETYVGKGEGIYHYQLDMENGSLSLKTVARGVENPSFLTVDTARSVLYAVNELEVFEGQESGAVSSFKVTSDGLQFLNIQSTGGMDPCHVVLTPDRRHLCVSNYMTGSECIYPLMEDGRIGDALQLIQNRGSGKNLLRQEGPHCHSTTFSPDGKYAFVMDLGTDRVMCYKVRNDAPVFVPSGHPEYITRPGSGPRCCCFAPSGSYMYLANELDNTILVLEYDRTTGFLTEKQRISALPDEMSGDGCTLADLHFTPDGRYLYGSNRGLNSIICYEAGEADGLLAYRGCRNCGGETPRNFAIDPEGKYLLCANQDSDNIVVFEIDHKTGNLEKKHIISVGSPVCIRIY